MLYRAKGEFQKAVRWLGGSWMTANMATALGCVAIGLVAASLYAGLACEGLRWLLLLVPIFLLARMAMNTLDGMLSRERGTGTVAGEIWNEALDIVGDTVCYGVLYFVPGGPRLSIVVFILLAWAAEYFGVLGKGMPGGTRRHETVLGGKPDRAVWMAALAVLLFLFPGFLPHVDYYLAVVCFFVALTSVIRVRKTIQAARGRQYQSYTWIGR
jgi:CDP-diacylglycerol--glycerol-3-phosphate 3-phosphatidyltransferase